MFLVDSFACECCKIAQMSRAEVVNVRGMLNVLKSRASDWKTRIYAFAVTQQVVEF